MSESLPFRKAVIHVEGTDPFYTEIINHDGSIETTSLSMRQIIAFAQRHKQTVVRFAPCAADAPGAIGTPLTHIEKENGEMVWFLEKAPTVVTLRFHETRGTPVRQYRFPVPRLLFTIQLRNEGGQLQHVETYVAALREPLRDPDQRLYHYPGPNCYRDGRICWGTFRVPTPNLRDLAEIPRYLFEIVGNNDLDNQGRTEWSSTRAMLEELQQTNALVFPSERLRPNGYTVRSWVERFGGELITL